MIVSSSMWCEMGALSQVVVNVRVMTLRMEIWGCLGLGRGGEQDEGWL